MTPSPGITPLYDHLLLDVTPEDKPTSGGIILPDQAKDTATRMEGVVVARGPECKHEQLTPGVRVLAGKYASNDIVRAGRKYRLAKETEILAILEP
jgi:co-chaperonin GroES (HSP10)